MACCPLPTAQTTITPTTCEFNINQIHRVWEVRKGEIVFDIAVPLNNVPATIINLAPEAITAWDILKIAADSTKMLFLPLFGGSPSIEPGEEITFGGGSNETLNGKQQHIGYSPSQFLARFDGLEAQQEKDINEIACEGDGVEVFFVLHDGRIMGALDAATSNLFTGISVETALTLLGRKVEGFSQKDSNDFKFQIPKVWSETMHAITPTFNALTAI